MAQTNNDNTNSTSKSTIITSKLLIWPRNQLPNNNNANAKQKQKQRQQQQQQQRRRKQQQQQQRREESGFVLGWKIPTTSTSTTAETHRETIICAGILPIKSSLEKKKKDDNNDNDHDLLSLSLLALEEYQKNILKLQNVISESKKSKSNSLCSCLIDSLQIVAYFRGNEPSSINISKTAASTTPMIIKVKKLLPIISLQRGYPWWEDNDNENNIDNDDGNSDNNNKTTRNVTNYCHRQVLYYHQNQINNDNFHQEYSHWSSEFENIYNFSDNDNDTSSSTSSWTQLLQRLSYAQEITHIIQTGGGGSDIGSWATTILQPVSKTNYETLQHADIPSLTDTNTTTTATSTTFPSSSFANDSNKDTLWEKQLQSMNAIFSRSITIVHFQQLLHRGNNGIQSAISIWHCLQLWNQTRLLNSSSSLSNNICDTTSATSMKSKQQQQQQDNGYYACACCGKSSLFPNKKQAVLYHVTKWDEFLTALLDTAGGILFALFLCFLWQFSFSNNQSTTTATTTTATANLLTMLVSTLYQWKVAWVQTFQQYITWLEHFPAGFKLNVRLTTTMGHLIHQLISYHDDWMDTLLWQQQQQKEEQEDQQHEQQQYLLTMIIVATTSSFSFFGGFSTILAILMDLYRLQILLPITIILSGCIRIVYQIELYLLAAFWRLFRGKKRNILRQRTDSMQYDAMQLLVGTIGFSICIFLFTTLWVYYTFFVLWNIVLHIPLILLWSLYTMSRTPVGGGTRERAERSSTTLTCIPWGTLFWRIQKPFWFTENVSIQTQKDTEFIHISWLQAQAKSPIKILTSRCMIHFKPLFGWLLNFLLEILFPRAAAANNNNNNTSSSSSPCTMPFADFL